jgi:hypothetical protein
VLAFASRRAATPKGSVDVDNELNCYACGEALSETLAFVGALFCHDCRRADTRVGEGAGGARSKDDDEAVRDS